MIIKNEVELHQDSIDYVKEVFSRYEEVDSLNKIIHDPIVHMYPVEDTYDTNGNLDGYIDAVFFRVNIYDTTNMTVYKGIRLHDAIMPFEKLRINQIKIFKDLSTMIVLRGDYQISLSFAAIDIEPVK